MKQQILGSDFAKLGTGSEDNMALVKVNPGYQHSGISNAFLLWFIDLVCLYCWLKRKQHLPEQSVMNLAIYCTSY